MVLGIVGNLVGWLVGLFVGGLALFVAAELVGAGNNDLEYGLVTALVGAVVWAVLSLVPLVGWLLAPVGWVGVINWRYPGDWQQAVVVAVVAWVVALVVLYVLGALGLGGLSAVGIPLT